MSIRVHIVNRQEPIVWNQEDQLAICGWMVDKAVPVNIVPDVMLCSVGIIASTFGHAMCSRCQREDDPADGWVYFVMSKEDAQKYEKKKLQYAEVL